MPASRTRRGLLACFQLPIGAKTSDRIGEAVRLRDKVLPSLSVNAIASGWITLTRKVKEGEANVDLFAFLTTEANGVVGPIHPKAMPVILTNEDEIETWMSAPPQEALRLQRPLPDDALRIVARGERSDDIAA
jgi:putative SOS response-associated peptidase YedK